MMTRYRVSTRYRYPISGHMRHVPISGQKKTPISGHMTRYRVSGWPDIIWNPVHLDRIGQIGTYWYVPVRTGTTWYKAVRESHGRTYRYVLVHTSTYTQEDKLFPDSSRKSQKR